MPRFRDIKPFTHDAGYGVDIPLSMLEEQIESWSKAYQMELDPDFQRGHVWTDEQRSRYIEYLLRGGISSRIIYFNCPGWQSGSGKVGQLIIVDGKQRLEACRRFVRSEIPAFGYLRKEYSDDIFPFSPHLRFAINNLRTRAEVLQWYLDLNSGGVVHTSAEIEKVQKLLEAEKGKK